MPGDSIDKRHGDCGDHAGDHLDVEDFELFGAIRKDPLTIYMIAPTMYEVKSTWRAFITSSLRLGV